LDALIEAIGEEEEEAPAKAAKKSTKTKSTKKTAKSAKKTTKVAKKSSKKDEEEKGPILVKMTVNGKEKKGTFIKSTPSESHHYIKIGSGDAKKYPAEQFEKAGGKDKKAGYSYVQQVEPEEDDEAESAWNSKFDLWPRGSA
jgi:hypothetical protein